MEPRKEIYIFITSTCFLRLRFSVGVYKGLGNTVKPSVFLEKRDTEWMVVTEIVMAPKKKLLPRSRTKIGDYTPL